MNDYLTTKEAAAIIGCVPGHVSRLYHAGRIAGKMMGPRMLLVERTSVEQYTPIRADSWEGRQAGLRAIEWAQPYHRKGVA